MKKGTTSRGAGPQGPREGEDTAAIVTGRPQQALFLRPRLSIIAEPSGLKVAVRATLDRRDRG